VAETAQGLKGRVLGKMFVLPIESWFFTFFYFFFVHGSTWCHLQCDHYDLDVNFLILFKKFHKVHNVEVLNQDLHQLKKFSSLIITSMELRFEPCAFNLNWKWGAKDPKKREDHLILIYFGIKKFTIKKTQRKKTLMFECYNLLDHMEWGAAIFWGWFPRK
jgi:hypothetical protein